MESVRSRFFEDCEPHILDLSEQHVRNPEDFKQFECNHPWKLGRPMRDDRPALHSIIVLRLQVNRSASLVAKTFFDKEYFESKRELDPFLNESRAYEHILYNCPPSKLSYFPTYSGVLNLTREQYPRTYALRPRAIVLERIKPNLSSRRILGVSPGRKFHLFDSFVAEITELSLSCFEKKWFTSLAIDRLRRLTALHEIGIIHRDICDEHFRLHDYYDSVLYDFSHSYIVNSPWPFPKRFKPLMELIHIEQTEVLGDILNRAKKSDLRAHIAATLNLNQETVVEFCTRKLEGMELELICLKTRHRPDTWTHPSLASIFPFLEAIRPTPAWHITMSRLLQEFQSAWFSYTPETKHVDPIAFCGVECFEQNLDEIIMEQNFLLILFPGSWEVDKQRLLICARRVANEGWGPIITKKEFDGIKN
ncbi:hypothetical protein BO71DRAFT_380100 [Aspergillus ellipticus CBS 707.79]|uniref:Protein kinase domain-containing protein n=1 Tax=Aspergillus ellipticus CBS 707.79 TaxID=1448320 RepID=A0A319D9T2_9EURO|nr:hypothetical protein BO71DRAFT_380100 [Aspergillus ellipticus CBS 707.79]